MVKKNSFFESLNLFNNKSAKKSYNGILIIAGILGVMFLMGLVVGFASDSVENDAGSIHIYNSTGSLNVFATNRNLTAANEGVQFFFFINLTNGEVPEDNLGTAQTNITNVTVTFDKEWTIIGYNFSRSDIEGLCGNNTATANDN